MCVATAPKDGNLEIYSMEYEKAKESSNLKRYTVNLRVFVETLSQM